MRRKFEKLKSLQAEASSLSSELAELKAESIRVHWQIERIRQDSNDGTDTSPFIARLQTARNEIEKLGKKSESLTESIQDLSTTLMNYAIREIEAQIDKDYEALNIIKVDYDKSWRQLQNDENNRLKQASVKGLRDKKIKIEDSIRQNEHLRKMLEASSTLSLDKYFAQEEMATV